MLVLDAETSNDAKEEPEAVDDRGLKVVGGGLGRQVDDANKQLCAAHPKERLENIHRVEVSHAKVNECSERGGTGEDDGPRTPAELARDRAGKSERERPGESGKETQSEE